MTVAFTKTGERRYATRVRRADGVELEVPSHDRPAVLPHDLAHFIVEKEMGLRRGFWGCVAAGALFPGMKPLSGRQAPHAAEKSRQIQKESETTQRGTEAEVLAGLFAHLIEEGMENDLAVVMDRLNSAWRPAKPSREPISKEEARRVCAALREAQRRWRELETGGELVFIW